ncbi:MFS transporter [Saccharothrix obliqua]|uniref:MFS transporter n=1 Tax=Saccharothrix obliqua TaxID=2861747 RepID=UPI001C6027AB|nr:MFS transporter [Saccharothrix obliqua]MBW4722247.1 MFS transporter [Saccharothrix obliqua]
MTHAFARFWAADTVSLVGTHVTTLALGVLAMGELGASSAELGLIQAAPWVPYLLFGLLAGVLVDRVRRRPVLIGADLARSAVLGMIPLLHVAGVLSVPVLVGLMAVFGTLSLAYDAAHQSFLPRLVPASGLTRANARMEQTRATAQSVGPMVAGWLTKAVGAPFAIVVDAVSYLLSALILTTVRVAEPVPRSASRDLWGELRSGLAWVYRHPVLSPLALTSHTWFLFNSMVTPVFAFLMYRELGFDEFQMGLVFAFGGVGSVVGASLSTRAAERFGPGAIIVLGRWLTPAAYALVPFSSHGATGLVLLCAAQFTWGFGVGIDGPPEMGYRQAVTPDHLQGRMNATIRSVNRGMIVLGAPLGGALAAVTSTRTAVWVAVAGLLAQAAAITLSPVRRARQPEVALGTEPPAAAP